VRQYARDETECEKQCVIDSSRVESRSLWSQLSLSRYLCVVSLRGRIRSLFILCHLLFYVVFYVIYFMLSCYFINLRRQRPIILNNSIRIEYNRYILHIYIYMCVCVCVCRSHAATRLLNSIKLDKVGRRDFENRIRAKVSSHGG